MAIDWQPVEKARRQEIYLVGHEAFKGWFKIANLNALGEWRAGESGAGDLLERQPTHFANLNPPENTFAFAVGHA